MKNEKKYTNYFASEASKLKASKRFMVSTYSKYPFLGQPYRFLKRSAPDIHRVLDVGAGLGNYLLITKQLIPHASYFACDLCRSLAHDELSDVSFQSCDFDVQKLPYPDDSFDHINCMHVIEHLHNPIDFLKECYRVLRPNGTLYIEAPDVRLTFVPHIPFLTGKQGVLNFWDDPTHIRPYSCPSLMKITSMAQFTETVDCFYIYRLAHLLAFPLALFSLNNDYKAALLHALGFFCGIIVKKSSLTN